MQSRRHLPVFSFSLDDIGHGFKQECLAVLAIEAL